jgi:RNA polymerase sigma factor (sigma-70 family)
MTEATGSELAERAADGEVEAFAALVLAHQAKAFGYALAILGDFHLAQDATQEAFVAAYFGLPGLRDRAKFAPWLRGIVRYQCGRFLRRRSESALGDAEALALATGGPTPEEWAVDREATGEVLAAIATLPPALRAVTVLFHLEGFSQREVAEFLSLPITTVNNRLHAARRRLKEGRLATMAETLRGRGLPDDFATTVVELIRARGPVIDLRFPAEPPPVLSTLDIGARRGEEPLVAGVMQSMPDGTTRCLVLSPAGATGLPQRVPVHAGAGPTGRAASPGTIRRALAALGATSTGDRVLETGLKAIDLLCPIAPGGAVGIFGDAGVGKAVLIGELLHNLGAAADGQTILGFVEQGEETTFMQRMLPQVPATDPARQAPYLVVEQARALDSAELTGAFDAIVYLSREIAGLHIFPAVDPLRSSSRLLTPEIVGEEHYRVAREVRDLLARHSATDEASGAEIPALDDVMAWRARQVRRFLGQPLFMAADFTTLPGQAVPLAETIRGCAAILRGDCDGLPLEAFWMVGTVGQVREKARKLSGS